MLSDKDERCKKGDGIPMKPLYLGSGAKGFYGFGCRADEEKGEDGANKIRSIAFATQDELETKLFSKQTKLWNCRFGNKSYYWDSLAIHERICYINGKADKIEIEENIKLPNPEIDESLSEGEKAQMKIENYKTSLESKYLKRMLEIIIKVREQFAEKVTDESGSVKFFEKGRKIKNTDIKLEKFKKSIEDQDKGIKKDEAKDSIKILKAFEFIKNFPHTLEPPSEDEFNFMLFRHGIRKGYKISIGNKQIQKETINLSKKDKELLSPQGIRIIQTPHSNRVFLIGGNDNPFGTYEFDLSTNKFFDDCDEYDIPRFFIPLDVGRSHHSLAATGGLIFGTGGHPDYYNRNSEENKGQEINLGRNIEVLKLKDKMWVSYSNKLMNSRFCHSSCIMGAYLYLFYGYDAANSTLITLSVERIKIKINEADLWGDSIYQPKNVMNDISPPEFMRGFNAVFPSSSGNKIICFGYQGLEKKGDKALDQVSLHFSDSKGQKTEKITVYDEVPRNSNKKYPLDEDKKEFKEAKENIENKQEEVEIEKNPLEEEYTHGPVFFGGLYFMPVLKDKSPLTYFDEEEERYKEVAGVVTIEQDDDSN